MVNIVNQNFIGTGNVITKDTEGYKAIAGNPARVVRDLRQDQPGSAVVEGTN